MGAAIEVPFFSMEAMRGDVRAQSVAAFERVLDSAWYLLGTELETFEQAFSAYVGTKQTVGVGSGLDALTLSLRALDIGPSDEVIVPAHTFVATVLAILTVGATPVLVEPDEYYLLSAEAVKKVVTPKTRAIIPVHLYGQACNMEALMAVAKEENCYMLEDNSQAHGASWGGQRTGSFGHLGAQSFYPVKPLGALGDGGAITVNKPMWADRLRQLRNYGSDQKYHYQELGVNSRLDEVQAAQLSVRLDFLDQWTAQRQALAGNYLELLEGVGDVVLPATQPGATHVYHLFVIRTERRDELVEFLRQKGIETLIHYPLPLHLQPALRGLGYRKGDFPITEFYSNTCVSLPIYPGLTEAKQRQVTVAIRQFFAG